MNRSGRHDSGNHDSGNHDTVGTPSARMNGGVDFHTLATLDFQSSLRDLLGIVMDLGQLGQVSAAILLYDESTGLLQLGACWGEPQDTPCFRGVMQAAECCCGYAIQSGEPLVCAASLVEAAEHARMQGCPGPADIYVPLVASGRRVGLLELWLAGEPSSAATDFLELITPRLSAAVERARAYEDACRHNYEIMVLMRTGQLITSTLDLDEVLLLIASEARTMLQAESVWVLLSDAPNAELVFAAVAGPDAEQLEGTCIPLKTGVAGWVAERQRSVLVVDAQADARFYIAIDEKRDARSGSLVVVPISCKGQAIGVIEAVNSTVGSFKIHDVDLLEVLAGYAAIAIENARLYEAERELRRVTEESQMLLAQSDRLATVGRMTASLAHELNNPLQALHNSLQVILAFPLEEEEKDSYIQMADEEVTRLIDMVNRILEFSRRPFEEMKAVDLNAVARRVLDLATKYLQHQHIVLDLQLADTLPEIAGNPGRLGQVLLNLVINAVEAMPSGGTLHIGTEAAGNGSVLLRVADTGPGIAPETMDHLFEPFFSTKREGTGLGLSISKTIVTQHGGVISVQTNPGEGTQFEVELPVSA